MRPYPEPLFVKSKKRCQFRMPKRAYNCRCIGHYDLNGRMYCAHHYDIAWKVSNPEYGQAHQWHFHVNRFTNAVDRYESCKRCGVIRQHEGLPVTPCDGLMPIIELR